VEPQWRGSRTNFPAFPVTVRPKSHGDKSNRGTDEHQFEKGSGSEVGHNRLFCGTSSKWKGGVPLYKRETGWLLNRDLIDPVTGLEPIHWAPLIAGKWLEVKQKEEKGGKNVPNRRGRRRNRQMKGPYLVPLGGKGGA